MKRFQELLMKDLGWKLLSVAISITMWFMVINITQPVDTRSYSRPISVENAEALTQRGLTVGNKEALENTKVLVKVKAQRTALDRLNQNPEWIQANVDLSELTYNVNGDIVALPITVSMQGGVTGYGIVSKTPGSIDVEVETLLTKTFPVEIILNGDLAENVYLSAPRLSAENVLVTGPRSAVETVKSVKANVNAEDLQHTPQVRAALTAYDKDGRTVKDVSINIRDVKISYSLQEPKQVPIQIEVTGTPAAGYQIGKITCVPASAQIIGKAENLTNISAIQPHAIDISGLTESASHMLTLADYLPEGLSVAEGSGTVAQVVVEIIPLSSKQITLEPASLTLTGTEEEKLYTVEAVQLTVSGKTEALDSLQPEAVTASADVTGLTDGTHTVPLQLKLPEGLTAEDVTVTVTIGSNEEPPQEEE